MEGGGEVEGGVEVGGGWDGPLGVFVVITEDGSSTATIVTWERRREKRKGCGKGVCGKGGKGKRWGVAQLMTKDCQVLMWRTSKKDRRRVAVSEAEKTQFLLIL